MSQGHAAPLSTDWPQPGRERHWTRVIPSWLASVAMHTTLLFLAASSLKSCGDGTPMASEGNYREVGIYVKQPQEAETQQTSQQQQTPQQEASETATAEQPVAEDMPPVALALPPVDSLPVIGAGAAPPVSDSDALDDAARPNQILNAARAAEGPGEIEFFGIRDAGKRFVYVLDSSGSMSRHYAIGVAKAELMASLNALEPDQQFQIIFYNLSPRAMKLRGKNQDGLYWATEINRTLARQFIASTQPESGTDHQPALFRALELEPDVLFLLTDAKEPRLTAAQRDDIRQRNRSDARIHCIEFGEGEDLGLDNFLKALARENGGTYQYRDVRTFKRR